MSAHDNNRPPHAALLHLPLGSTGLKLGPAAAVAKKGGRKAIDATVSGANGVGHVLHGLAGVLTPVLHGGGAVIAAGAGGVTSTFVQAHRAVADAKNQFQQ